MMNLLARARLAGLVAMTATAGALGACGDSDSAGSTRFVDDAGRDASSTGAGGSAGFGAGPGLGTGAQAAGGATDSGAGGSGAAGGAEAGACVSAATIDPAIFPTCPVDLCQNARCVPNSLVPADVSEQLADCDPDNKCVPDDFVATGGNFLLETCISLDGAEGRCVPSCLPAVQSQASFLPQATCADGELCAPCFNPIDGSDTGACGVSCDPGATDAPVVFEKCCGGIGSCVPAAVVPSELQASLGSDTCTDATRLCAPDAFTDSTVQPATCRSIGDTEGRCIPDCVPAVQERADSLEQGTCAAGELCAPCYDPTTGDSTGSCNINGDAPVEDPKIFAKCCSDLGTCVPESAVPAEQQALLSSDTCTGAGELCAPTALIDATYTPPTCTSVGGFEGRCLPSCLPDVAAQADRLPTDICDPGHLCAPCYDPVTGENTGACSLNGDAPSNEPGLFDPCCDGAGRCVPESLVPAEQQDFLGTCAEPGTLCAPTALVDTSYVPPTCESIAGAEGRCLPDCLPSVAEQADRLPQADCAAGELCAPCYDPLTGDATGACGVNGDAPVEPPFVFTGCCGGLGSCVPTSLVPAEQQSLLDADTCTGEGELCAPTALADSSYQPPSCDSVGGFEGRCLPACLPDVEAQADRLPPDTCAEGELCAPCFDPITGEDTGACSLNGDAPSEPPGTFEICCGGLGTCVPSTLVPAEQQAMLGTDVCTTEGQLCAPTKLTDSSYIPASCESIAGAEGRCLAACLPDIAAQADRLSQATCDAGELCAPCYDPLTGELTGACNVNGDAPVEPPYVFETCCGGLGSCVPTELVPMDQQSLLGTDTCSEQGVLCAPTALTDSTYQPPACDSIGGFEGRCLPACLPDIAAQSDRLTQSTCDTGHLCAPCYDPITGEDTGACRVNGDAPTEPVGTFQNCCGGLGSCVPSSLVPAEQQSLLSQETCSDPGALCAPDKLVDTTYIPPTCSSLGGAEGRCLAACLPDVAARADQLPQDICDTGELCAPCYDPLTGEATGACELNGDAPVEPPFIFDKCCPENGTTHGTCIPTSALTDSQAASLPQLTCPDSTWRCVPDAKVADPTAPLPSCSYGIAAVQCYPILVNLGCTGACLRSCFIDPLQAGLLESRECAGGALCAPCTNPLDGQPTGACE